MILHLESGAPLVARAAAAGLLALHIGGGLVGLASGATALAAPKGGRLHRRAGHVFLVAMLAMALIGAAVSPFLPQRANVVPGLLTAYLVASGWRAGRQRNGATGRFEAVAMAAALATAAIGVLFAFQAAASPTGLDGDRSPVFLVFAALAAAPAALDAVMIRKGGLSGPSRIARHLWRLCLAMLIATSSLFLGQPKVFPAGLRGSPLMFAPEIALLATWIYWAIRVRPRRRAPTGAASVSPPVESTARAGTGPPGVRLKAWGLRSGPYSEEARVRRATLAASPSAPTQPMGQRALYNDVNE